jgi:hypothetical protein
MSTDSTQGAIPTPLSMLVSLFTQQLPHPHLLPTVKRILEHALSIARNRGLLSSGANPLSDGFAHNRVQPRQFTFSDLIPRKTRNVELIQLGNPFADNTVISDKQARQLDFFIDGKRSISELVEITHLDQQEFNSALRFLLKQKHIQLHNSDGKAVESSQFFEPL